MDAELGYRIIYESLQPKLSAIQYGDLTSRLGFHTLDNGGGVGIHFLARDYVITRESVTVLGQPPVPVNHLSILAYYALSGGSSPPTGLYREINKLTGMVTGAHERNPSWMTSPLADAFRADYPAFSRGLVDLGASYDGPMGNYAFVWRMALLPKIPIEVVYYEADDEFPCKIKVRFDTCCTNYLDFEVLAFLKGSFVNALLHTL